MAKEKKNDKGLVLSYEKKLVPSDGFLYGTTWDEREINAVPLQLAEKAVRGTISNRQAPAIEGDPLKINALIKNPNLQVVDSCYLGKNQDTLKLEFTLKVLGNLEETSACNDPELAAAYRDAFVNYVKRFGFGEIARRYAMNIANGRFLWRNRVGTEKVEVVVKHNDTVWTFDALSFSLRDFNKNVDKVAELANAIEQAFSGVVDYTLFDVTAYAKIGRAQEVYPSQELPLDKGTRKKSKVLYSVDGVAAMHSQKLGNAIRTIDTWYTAYGSTEGIGPIAAEPYGAVTNRSMAYRLPKDKADFYTLYNKFVAGEELSDDEANYVMSVIVRGGVFSGKE